MTLAREGVETPRLLYFGGLRWERAGGLGLEEGKRECYVLAGVCCAGPTMKLFVRVLDDVCG